MINGTEIRAARERAGMTQGQLAHAVGVSLRTVGNWERGDTVPMNRASAVEAALAQWLNPEEGGPRLAAASDAELLAEIARRFERGATEKFSDRRRRELRQSGVVPFDLAHTRDERAVANEDDTLDRISEDQQQEP